MSDPKLAELTSDDRFRERVAAVLGDLARLDERPKIYEAKRTLTQQREKVRLGYSRTLRSQHVDRGSDGGACAADVADARHAWNASRRFWFIIGASCQSRGLGWGGLFGLKRAQVRAFLQAVELLRAAGWPRTHPAYQTPIGWDPAHIQARNNWRSWLDVIRDVLG